MSIHSDAYSKHMNLKLAANELGIPWQTLYVILKKEGVAVIGDKLRYGSGGDRLGAMAESEFSRLVPKAKNMNASSFQSKYDFEIGSLKIDVKCRLPRQLNKRFAAKSWSFSFKKQSLICDFICCFCKDENKNTVNVLLVPSEFFKGLQTVSVSCNGGSKWLDYSVAASDLAQFFDSLEDQ